jgi:pantetheine-phosphate adenylyltransferase
MVTALYPGTFDPVTYGHVDIVKRAAQVFDQVLVAVYDMPPKSLLFTTEERVGLFRDSIKDIKNARVVPFSGLVVKFAEQAGAKVMIRGLRAGQDFEYEFDMSLMNKHMAPEIESVYMMSSLAFQFLSASRVKEVVQLGGDVKSFVPENVLHALKAKLHQTAR